MPDSRKRMPRAILAPRSRLALVVALAALGVFAVHDDRPAAADHDATTFWSATLTVQDMGGARYGCDNTISGDECSAALTDDGFTYEGADYEVVSINLRRGALIVTLDGDIPEEMNVLTLRVDDVDLALEDSNPNNDEEMRWLRTGIEWDEGDAVELSLTRLPPPSGVELSTRTLAVTEGSSGDFTIALSADPGASTTVTLVRTQYFQPEYGEPGHRWNLNAASISPATLTFTSGGSGNWGTAQTVTVSGAEDADTCNEQLIILVLVQTSAGSGNVNPVYEPVGGSSNSVTGIFVTVADDDNGQGCGGI